MRSTRCFWSGSIPHKDCLRIRRPRGLRPRPAQGSQPSRILDSTQNRSPHFHRARSRCLTNKAMKTLPQQGHMPPKVKVQKLSPRLTPVFDMCLSFWP